MQQLAKSIAANEDATMPDIDEDDEEDVEDEVGEESTAAPGSDAARKAAEDAKGADSIFGVKRMTLSKAKTSLGIMSLGEACRAPPALARRAGRMAEPSPEPAGAPAEGAGEAAAVEATDGHEADGERASGARGSVVRRRSSAGNMVGKVDTETKKDSLAWALCPNPISWL